MNCAACCSIIIDKESFLCCTLASCNKNYHLLCAGRTLDVCSKTWICPECRCATKKGGDNSLTPVGFSKKNRDQNVTLRHRKVPTLIEMSGAGESNELACEMRELKKEIAMMKEQLSIFTTTHENKLSHAISTIADYDEKLRQAVTMMESYDIKIGKYECQMQKLHDMWKGKQEFMLENLVTAPQVFQPHIGPPLGASQLQPQSSLSDFSHLHQPIPEGLQSQPQPPASLPSPQRRPPPLLPSPQPQPLPVLPMPQQQPPLVLSSPQCRPLTVVTSATKSVKPTQRKKNRKVAQNQSSDKFPLHTGSPRATLEPLASLVTTCNEQKAAEFGNKPGQGEDSQQWTQVTKRKDRKLTSLCGTAGPTVTSLKAVEAKRHLHLWNMESEIADVREYLDQLCPNGTCVVEELTARGNYKSYKIGVPIALYDVIYSTDVWPVNARINVWVNYGVTSKRKDPTERPSSLNPQPFRKRPSHGPSKAQ